MIEYKKIKTLEIIINDSDREEVYHDGIVTRSPDGTLWKIIVDNAGNLTTEKVV